MLVLTTRIEVRPVIKGLAGFGGIDDLLEERNDDLVKVHPIDPASVPNFAFGLDSDKLSPTTPKSIFSSEHLELMDAGESLIISVDALSNQSRARHVQQPSYLPTATKWTGCGRLNSF